MKKVIRLTENDLHRIVKSSVKSILKEGNKYVKGGNQQYAREKELEWDRQRIPQYYKSLMDDGKVYVSYCDDDFYEFLQQKGIKFKVQPCANYYEQTKFSLIKPQINEFTKKSRLIKNPDRYMQRLSKKGKLSKVGKFQDVNAVLANDDEVGTSLPVYKKDPSAYGTDDKNVESRKEIQQGDYIVNNVETPWNKWPVSQATFNKKYQSTDDPNVYHPKGEDMYASPALRRGVRFKPKNWGGYEANVDKGGRMMQSTKDSTDIYPIQGDFYNSSYRKK